MEFCWQCFENKSNTKECDECGFDYCLECNHTCSEEEKIGYLCHNCAKRTAKVVDSSYYGGFVCLECLLIVINSIIQKCS